MVKPGEGQPKPKGKYEQKWNSLKTSIGSLFGRKSGSKNISQATTPTIPMTYNPLHAPKTVPKTVPVNTTKTEQQVTQSASEQFESKQRIEAIIRGDKEAAKAIRSSPFSNGGKNRTALMYLNRTRPLIKPADMYPHEYLR